MCNHTYTADYAKLPRTMGEKCPWPEIFETARSSPRVEMEIDAALPLDSSGECIFHSREVEWKRAQDFAGWFRRLLELIETGELIQRFDFAEFVFVGQLSKEDGDSGVRPFRLAEATFDETMYFVAATFVDPVELEEVDFRDVSFRSARFDQDFSARRIRCRGFDASSATFAGGVILSDSDFRNFAIFHHASFTVQRKGFNVKFEDCRFQAITDFSGAEMALGTETTGGFVRVRFLDVVDFQNAAFRSLVVFDGVTVASKCEFIDTVFASVSSTARYRGAAVEFKDLLIEERGVLVFKSTNRLRKIFDHDVVMSFREEPAGLIQFENVNYHQLTSESKERLSRLAQQGKVEIGPGCIKYRLQTKTRTIPVREGNQSLVLELCQTFTNYFIASNGLNLGFELVDRTSSEVSFFYFTDEDVSEATFLARLEHTEQRLWNLLSRRPEHLALALEPADDSTDPGGREDNAVINAVDAISALLGTFFRAGARIAFGAWTGRDTKRLLEAIQFNEDGVEERARSLHKVIVDRYTGETLFGISQQQNELLMPMVSKDRRLLESGKIKVLFLGANSQKPRLGLDEEVKMLQTNLKLAKERDHLELQQEWAVTVDSLTQSLLDESPRIVHFSGHGEEDGIILQDDEGLPKLVSAKALSELFRLFRDTVHCVVLNSCYSEPQARAIQEHVPWVVGMNSNISDRTALAFSTGFYKAIGAGKEVGYAFELGVASIDLEGLPQSDRPVLLGRRSIDRS